MKPTFKKFSAIYWWLYIVLVAIVSISIIVYCCIFKNETDASSWASLISGIFTYVGSSMLGIFIYYNSWQLNKNQEFINQPRLDITPQVIHSEKSGGVTLHTYEQIKSSFNIGITKSLSNTSLRDDDFYYLPVKITNNSEHIVYAVHFESATIIRNKEITKQDCYYIHYDNANNDYIAFRETFTLFIGIEKILFDLDTPYKSNQSITYVLSFNDVFMRKYYHITQIKFIPPYGSVGISKKELIHKKEYEKRLNTYDAPLRMLSSIKHSKGCKIRVPLFSQRK